MKGSSFDYNFRTLADGTFTNIVAIPKVLTSTVGYALYPSSTNFKLMCRGTVGPTTISETSKITIKY